MVETKKDDKHKSLPERAKEAAAKRGIIIDPETLEGLKSIQKLHDLAKKAKSSPYQPYVSEEKE